MSDWIGLGFFVLLIFGVLVGLKILSKPRVSTNDEFERNAAENATLLGSGVNAINGMLNPECAKGKTAVEEVKKGTYNKKKEDAKGIGNYNIEDNDD